MWQTRSGKQQLKILSDSELDDAIAERKSLNDSGKMGMSGGIDLKTLQAEKTRRSSPANPAVKKPETPPLKSEWGPAEPYAAVSKKLSDAGAKWNSNLKLYEMPDGSKIREDRNPDNTVRYSVYPPGVSYWSTDATKVKRFGSIDEALTTAPDTPAADAAFNETSTDTPEGDFKPRDWATTWKNAAELDQHIAGLTPEQRMKEFEENSKNPRAPKPASRLKKMSDDDLQATYAVTTGDVELNREFKIELSRRGLYEKKGDEVPDSLKKSVEKVEKKVAEKPAAKAPAAKPTPKKKPSLDDPAIKKKLADVEMMFNEEGINYTPKGLFESRGRKYIAGRVQEARASGDNTITIKVPSGSEVEVPLDLAEALLVGLPAGT